KAVVTKEIIAQMKLAQEGLLGSKGQRTQSRPVKTNGVYTGGVAFERNDQVEGIKGSRCYTNGPSFQFSKNLLSPVAACKVMAHEITEEHRLRKDTAKVNSTDMGQFGAITGHIDEHDHPAALTSMISNSDLPPNYEPGRFHLLGLGLFATLEQFRVTTFSGLRRHGGTPPLAPRGQTIIDWAYRLMFVLYPPAAMLDSAGKSLVAVATEYPPNLVCTTPEMTTLLANFATDGPVLVPLPDLHDRYVHMLHSITSYYIRQLPLSLGCRIDQQKFFDAFSYVSNPSDDLQTPPPGNAPRISCRPWLTAHTCYTRQPYASQEENQSFLTPADQDSIALRHKCVQLWQEYTSKIGKFIPYYVVVTLSKKYSEEKTTMKKQFCGKASLGRYYLVYHNAQHIIPFNR
ncbi:hypothetical protein JOM56_013187, partial [Amanita muscaria]